MTILSFRTKKDKEKLLKKAQDMEYYASELVDCIEQARHGDYDEDEEYSERSDRSRRYRNRYDYR